MKLYCVSSTQFETLDEANEKLQAWFEDGVLDAEAAVYEVKKVFRPVIELVEE